MSHKVEPNLSQAGPLRTWLAGPGHREKEGGAGVQCYQVLAETDEGIPEMGGGDGYKRRY